MSIDSLHIVNFRNLKDINLNFSSSVNFFFGLNGSGKSSILESLFFLSRGKSFSQPLTKKLISFDSDEFILHAGLNNFIKLGISRSHTSNLIIKVNNNYINSSYILSQYLTLQILSPDSYLLITSSPNIRRKYIDWIVFHVKQNLFNHWKRYKEIIKNRNLCLKKKLSDDEIHAWDYELIKITNLITENRIHFITQINKKLAVYKTNYLSNMEIFVDFNCGWNSDLTYQQALSKSLHRDKLLGYTYYGLHKADFKLKIKIDDHYYLVKDVLSNGLIKYLSMFLYIIQIIIYQDNKDHIANYNVPIVLVDDLSSELDNNNALLIINLLLELNIQLFITFLENHDNNKLFNLFSNYNKKKLFHVKQGLIKEIINEHRKNEMV